MEEVRLLGFDVELVPPRFVPLDVDIVVDVDGQNTNPEGGYDCEIFYVRGLEPGKVLVLHKEVIHINHWAKSIIFKDAVDRMPNIEGRITGIMLRSGNMKAVWNRKPNGWVERPVPNNLTIVTNNTKENN